MLWPKNYSAELKRRMEIYKALSDDAEMLRGAKEYYGQDPVSFIEDNVWLYEPRNANKGDPVKIPAVLFPRQGEFVQWLKSSYEDGESGPVEKSRDSGATWTASAFAVWLLLFHPGSSVGFGSRKETLVDRAGDLSSIFEKIRMIVRNLPGYLLPAGFEEKRHMNYMRILNPENDASIIGEGGDNIGRGGRTSVYFVDEAAYLDHPQLVEAALSANTDVRIDISSPRVGSLFNETVETSDHKFIFDVSDAPWHTDEWREKKKAELEKKGLLHIFKQEYLRDPAAGVEGQLISSDLIEAAIGAAQKLGIRPTGETVAGMDVADGGSDKNALAIGRGIELSQMHVRSDLLAGDAGRWAYGLCERAGVERFMYDSIGVGAGVAAVLPKKKNMVCAGFNAAGKVTSAAKRYEGNRKNEDMFSNAKAQAWWSLRDRFVNTYNAVNGQDFDPDDLISISPGIEGLRELKSELAQITYKHNNAGKIVINKTPDGMRSPNRADSVMIRFAPSLIKYRPKKTGVNKQRDKWTRAFSRNSQVQSDWKVL